MTKKILLTGRKRISELAEGSAVDVKKQELLHLKSQELSSDAQIPVAVKPEQIQLSLDALEGAAVLEAAAIAKVEAKPHHIESKPVPIASVKPIAHVEDEITARAVQLQQYYHRLAKAGSAHRHQYTIQTRHDLLIQEIKKIVQQKARQNLGEGMREEANLNACQKFVEKLRQELLKHGVKINPLQVKKPGAKIY